MNEATANQEPQLTPEMFAALVRMRRTAVAALNTYRALLHDQSARLGTDADWLDGMIAHTLRNDFLRRATPSESPHG